MKQTLAPRERLHLAATRLWNLQNGAGDHGPQHRGQAIHRCKQVIVNAANEIGKTAIFTEKQGGS